MFDFTIMIAERVEAQECDAGPKPGNVPRSLYFFIVHITYYYVTFQENLRNTATALDNRISA